MDALSRHGRVGRASDLPFAGLGGEAIAELSYIDSTRVSVGGSGFFSGRGLAIYRFLALGSV